MNKVKKSSGRNDSSDPPGSGYQMNTAVGFEGQSAFQALPKTLAASDNETQ